MNDDTPPRGASGISRRTADLGTALLIFVVGAVVVVDSYRLGASWADDGPQSGYFPFYIGLLLCLSSIATAAQIAFAEWQRREQFAGAVAERQRQFVTWAALKQVLSVLLPAAAYVLFVQLIGIYVASALYIAFFMVWLGKYSWPKSAAIGLAVSTSVFLMFEVWFKVPLYKGAYDPLAWLGF